jgi:ubiquinone/menaquinone biosynthesis C-methylase UbiE
MDIRLIDIYVKVSGTLRVHGEQSGEASRTTNSRSTSTFALLHSLFARFRANVVAGNMADPDSPQVRLRTTYNQAADSYGKPPLSFWDRFGRRTVERLSLARGMAVLDICCGIGGSALPAAELVAPGGEVVALDLAENLLEMGTRRAAARGLSNVRFLPGDLERLPFPDQSFDAAICVFGIFFVPDYSGAVRRLWSLLRPNGFLAITIWSRGLFEPADAIFWEAVKREDLELYNSIKPWSKIAGAEAFRAFLIEGGIPDPEVATESGTHPINEPEDWWTIILGSGYRSTVESLSLAGRERVRLETISGVRETGIRELRTDVIYATARKNGSPQ